MLNFDLQVAILRSLVPSYIDEKRLEITSAQFKADQESFIFNLQYLKREKLIDLSSVSSRSTTTTTSLEDAIQLLNAKSDTYTLARCNITHAGIKALSTHLGTKFIRACE